MKLRLIVEIDYELNGESPDDTKERLEGAFHYVVDEGLLTGGSAAEVNSWETRIVKDRDPNEHDDCIHTCAECGEQLELVRPGKYQCPNQHADNKKRQIARGTWDDGDYFRGGSANFVGPTGTAVIHSGRMCSTYAISPKFGPGEHGRHSPILREAQQYVEERLAQLATAYAAEVRANAIDGVIEEG